MLDNLLSNAKAVTREPPEYSTQTNRLTETPKVESNSQYLNLPTVSAAAGGGGKLNLADIRLKYMLDAKTNEVTVYVLDRESEEVIRTIPPGELAKLCAGELLELFA